MTEKNDLRETLRSALDDIIGNVDKKITEIDARIQDLDIRYWPKIDREEARMRKSPSKIYARNYGMAWGEYKGQKDALIEVRNYFSHLRDYLANVTKPYLEQKIKAMFEDDEFREDQMDHMPDFDDSHNSSPDDPIMEKV